MRVLHFNYMDGKGKSSVRTVIEIAPPSDSHFCIDVTTFEPVDVVNLLNQFEEEQKRSIAAREEILANLNLTAKDSYRNFKKDRITNLEILEE